MCDDSVRFVKLLYIYRVGPWMLVCDGIVWSEKLVCDDTMRYSKLMHNDSVRQLKISSPYILRLIKLVITKLGLQNK